MLNFLTILFGKLLIFFSNILNLGSGSTWPGHIALKLNPNFIKDVLENSKTKAIIITGTNGKTTTGRLVTSIIREHGKTYLQNKAGANLINGLASTIVRGASLTRSLLGRLNQDYLIFESDENALPYVLEQINPDYIVCLNLFRDQLDRYGEVDSIAKKWQKSFEKLTKNTTLILNADDPQIAYLTNASKARSLFFGLDEKGKVETGHGADTTHCPKCSKKLGFQTVFFSHLGVWQCPNCNLKRPKPALSKLSYYPLKGTYNKYNSLAAALFAKAEAIKLENVDKSYTNFTPAFGRQENIVYNGKNVQIFLSKNPTSFNESLQTVRELNGKNLLILLNDRIPDGLDVSWIWDINLEEVLSTFVSIIVSGDRCYDMGLRIKYATSYEFQISNFKFQIEDDLKKSLDLALKQTSENQTLFVLPNYSAMLEIRKVLTGRKIL